MKIRRGETLRLSVDADSEDEASVDFIVARKNNYEVIYNENFPFTVMKAEIVVPSGTTDAWYDDEYYYQWTVHHVDGSIDKYPSADWCGDDECELPILEVCFSLDDPIIS